ncbi:MAG: hypothetical protein RLZ23_743 [Actinomycetota bacterium]
MNTFINKFFAIREIPVALALVIVLGVTAIANPAILSRSLRRQRCGISYCWTDLDYLHEVCRSLNRFHNWFLCLVDW